MFGIHERESVMFVHHQNGVVLAPDVEHGAVDYVGQGTLGVISDRRPEGVRIVASTKKPPLSSSE